MFKDLIKKEMFTKNYTSPDFGSW